MIKLFKEIGDVYVNPDHITFISQGTQLTTITTVGGGQIQVKEAPFEIFEKIAVQNELAARGRRTF